jgi:predicted O-methyltransferase YrrM
MSSSESEAVPAHADQAAQIVLETPDGALWAPPTRLVSDVLPTELAHLVPREQVLLYALVFAFAPERCLEIGVLHGGATRIIHAALSDLGRGCLVGIDPEPRIRIDWKTVADRTVLLTARSPEALKRAREIAGGPFDFVLLDGDHTADGARRDLEGLVDVTSPGALVLLHDAHNAEVERAVAGSLAAGLPYREAGMLARTPNRADPSAGTDPQTGELAVWGGLQLLVRTLNEKAPAPPTANVPCTPPSASP